MAKRLKHTIGAVSKTRFVVEAVDFDGVKTPKDLTGLFVYFELERESVQVISKDNDGVGGVTVTDAVNGVCVARIEHIDLLLDVGGEVDYGVLVRDPTGGDLEREEVLRGKMDLSLKLVDVP